jgi:hypothetical protein
MNYLTHFARLCFNPVITLQFHAVPSRPSDPPGNKIIRCFVVSIPTADLLGSAIFLILKSAAMPAINLEHFRTFPRPS